jgi:hypothetical protein
LVKEKSNFPMSDTKQDVPWTGGLNAAPDTMAAAKKVHSSRYEWEKKSNENEHQSDGPKATQRSLLSSLGRWVKRFFLGGRDLFDNDDDASPSAA